MLTISGLGFGEKYAMTLETLNYAKKADKVILRTKEHPSVSILDEYGINYISCDHFYDESSDFEKLYQSIAEFVYNESRNGDVLYLVPGSPSIAESTVKKLRLLDPNHNTIEAISFLEPCFSLAGIDPVDGAIFLDANDVNVKNLNPSLDLMITQPWNDFLLSDVKLALMEVYDDESEVYAIYDAGIKGKEKIDKIKLYELDREVSAGYRLTLIVPKAQYSLQEFIKEIIDGKDLKYKYNFEELVSARESIIEIVKKIADEVSCGEYELKELFMR
ncbi:MAG: SAM-dependent methyltransferase [Ezakiella sp.]|nr:SAM-dependent methyltransferase [Ezakiella sp.]MDD7762058.1 SAM-dependent methyltransferase [Bacillota bacterium]MDY3946980.1 SAM-dependent methyltransferase [Ezakiella sp.]